MLLTNDTVIQDKAMLISFFEKSCKPRHDWKIGVEYEQFVSHYSSSKPLTYQGAPGICDIFKELQLDGWVPQLEQGIITKLKKDFSTISMEPGGQLELATAPYLNIHELDNEIKSYVVTLKKIAKKLNVVFSPIGSHPSWSLEDIPRMPNPNGRYNILFNYMNKTGSHGIDMMLRTCSIQVSLDYGSESDMIKKYRLALLLQPIISALFVNSSFLNGSISKYLSYRGYAWMNTCADRCGILPVAFNDNFCFEQYVDFMLELPLYFVCKNGVYIDALGQPFQDFMKGKLKILPNALPTFDDWMAHLTSIWPEARLTNVIEMRGADSCPPPYVTALSALWAGLFYDASSLEAVEDVARGWNHEFINGLRHKIICEGLNAGIASLTVWDITKELVLIAERGLDRRAQLNTSGNSEILFLKPIHEILNRKLTLAERSTRPGKNIYF